MGYLARSPAVDVKFGKEQGKVPEALTELQLAALLEHLPERNHPVVILAADTGLRRSELWALTWEDVNWAEQELVVRRSKNSEWRVIPLTNRALEVLRQGREAAGRSKVQKLDNRILPADLPPLPPHWVYPSTRCTTTTSGRRLRLSQDTPLLVK